MRRFFAMLVVVLLILPTFSQEANAQVRTQKPPLHGSHWMAITGKPLGATAGAMMFQKGGNAVDAAAAMLGATCTMWDTLGWGGETQALIYNPKTKKVIGINALGVAPAGATAEFFKSRDMRYPPEYGPLAATTPGTPGGLMFMLAEYGTLSLKDVLEPSIQMADGYPIERQAADAIERHKKRIREWPWSRKIFLVNEKEGAAESDAGETARQGGAVPLQDQIGGEVSGSREGPEPGSMFRQKDLAATLRKLVEAEQEALKKGASRKEAIYAAHDRFYKGDIAREIVRGTRQQGGLFDEADLASWKPRVEEPVKTTYKGIDVYKLTVWTQGPAMLQALNILENFDVKAMTYNSAPYIHTLYQAMNLAFADRDFYYGDPTVEPAEPVAGLLSKEYAKERAKQIRRDRNDPNAGPGDPYPFQNGVNPFRDLLANWGATASAPKSAVLSMKPSPFDESPFYAGTTTVQAADAEGWVVSITPSGGWIPAVIAGDTGIGLSQRMQSFVTDRAENPYNVVEPGKQPRVTLTPTLAMKDGAPFLSFAVQGGDSQDQNLLQFFLNIVEFGMTVQEAAEAANFNSFQMRESFGEHTIDPGKMVLQEGTPPWVRRELEKMGYRLEFSERTSGPINAIFFDRTHGTMWGGSSNHGEDHGIAW